MPRKTSKTKKEKVPGSPSAPRKWRGGNSYESRKAQVAALLEDDQPFVLSRYLVTANFITETSDWFHEIILWQTREGDREQQSLVLTPPIFRRLVREFDMKMVDHTEYGTIYECNSLLRDLCEEFRKEIAGYVDDLREARQLYAVKKVGVTREWAMGLRERIGAAEEQIARAERRFREDHGIYTYRFCREKGDALDDLPAVLLDDEEEDEFQDVLEEAYSEVEEI